MEVCESWCWGSELLGDEEEECRSVTVATDSESAIDHSRRCCVKTRWSERALLEEALEGGKLEFEKVDTAMNRADVCT